MKKFLIIAAIVLAGKIAVSQKTLADSVANATKTPAAIVEALYQVISGNAGQQRNWAFFRSLFTANAKMIPTSNKKDSTPQNLFITVEDYINIAGPQLEKRGFWEKEIGNTTEIFGNIAHVWSTYESRNKQTDATPFMRGINSIQLWHDGKRWWIMNIMWLAEGKDMQLPKKYITQ